MVDRAARLHCSVLVIDLLKVDFLASAWMSMVPKSAGPSLGEHYLHCFLGAHGVSAFY